MDRMVIYSGDSVSSSTLGVYEGCSNRYSAQVLSTTTHRILITFDADYSGNDDGISFNFVFGNYYIDAVQFFLVLIINLNNLPMTS